MILATRLHKSRVLAFGQNTRFLVARIAERMAARRPATPVVSDEVKLFASTFVGGFLFMLLYLG